MTTMVVWRLLRLPREEAANLLQQRLRRNPQAQLLLMM